MNPGRITILFGMLTLLNLGCATTPRESESGPSSLSLSSSLSSSASTLSEFLLPVSTLTDDLVLQQRVTIRWQDREEHFDAVFQKRGDELLLLGLGPMNSVGFTLTLDGEGVRFENRSGRELPFEPERILADVQRVFYPWMADEKSCTNCEQYIVRGDLEVSEKIGPERILERRFVDLSGRRDKEILVRFEDWLEGETIPSRAILRNGWYGYELTVETLSVEHLE
jgi:hypothetical protein